MKMEKYQITGVEFEAVRRFVIQNFNPDQDVVAIADAEGSVLVALENEKVLNLFQEQFHLVRLHDEVLMQLIIGDRINGMMGNTSAINFLTNAQI